MRVLVITNLFPNAEHPRVASFNRQQFAALGKLCEVEVLATQPWYPGQRLLGRFASHATALNPPRQERIDGLTVFHPRTLHLPKIGTSIATPLFAASLMPLLRRYRGKVDVVLASWAHPDGCAAVLLAKLLGVPCVVKVHGTDINQGMRLPGPRRMMKALLPRADALVAVSSPLADELCKLGVDADRIHLVMNGVDGSTFFPRDRARARRELGLPVDGRIALCVGNLIEAKGVFDLCEAFALLRGTHPQFDMYMVGGGSQEQELRDHAPDRMHVVGSQPFEKIPLWMAACDVLVLPSWNEGTPNVLLEALACGRRIVATRVGGVPDVMHSPALGSMVEPKRPEELAEAIAREIAVDYDGAHIAALGARGDWQQSAAMLAKVLSSVVDKKA